MDFLNNQGLFCKAKSIVLSLAEIILLASGLASTMQTPNESQTRTENLKPGLKTLVHNQKEENPSCKTSHRPPLPQPEKIIHSYMVSTPPAPWTTTSSSPPPFSSCSSTMLDSSSSSSLTMGDLIGGESGVYMSAVDEEQILENQTSCISPIHGKYRNQRNTTKKEYPPPIPSLARTGNLLGRMPWVLTRDYTADGRLVMKVMRVKRHEFFHAHRANGRLILKLIPLDDVINDFDAPCEEVEEEEDLELEDYVRIVDQEDKGKEKIVTEQEEEEEETEGDEKDEDSVLESYSKNIGSNKTVGKFPKCYTYASGMFMDSNKSFCNKGGKVHGRPLHTFLDQSTSASLRPIASVI